jgi:hypothetical protein
LEAGATNSHSGLLNASKAKFFAAILKDVKPLLILDKQYQIFQQLQGFFIKKRIPASIGDKLDVDSVSSTE